MKDRITLAVSSFAVLLLAGCVSPVQVDEKKNISATAPEPQTAVFSDDPYVDFSILSEGRATMTTALMGSPNTNSNLRKVSSVCTGTRDYAGKITPIKYEYSADTSTGMATMVFPIERTATGVKAYVEISKLSATDPKLVEISKDCKLPVAVTSTAGLSVVQTFEWDQPTKLKFSDGSGVIVKATQVQRASENL